MQIYATFVSLFDKKLFAQRFATFLAERRLRGVQFAELSEIPQYQVSRILGAKLKTFGTVHSKICRFMQIDEGVFFFDTEDTFAGAIDKFCNVGVPRAQQLARVIEDIVALLKSMGP